MKIDLDVGLIHTKARAACYKRYRLSLCVNSIIDNNINHSSEDIVCSSPLGVNRPPLTLNFTPLQRTSNAVHKETGLLATSIYFTVLRIPGNSTKCFRSPPDQTISDLTKHILNNFINEN